MKSLKKLKTLKQNDLSENSSFIFEVKVAEEMSDDPFESDADSIEI